MDHDGLGNGSREAGRAGVVILSGACCNPSLGGLLYKNPVPVHAS